MSSLKSVKIRVLKLGVKQTVKPPTRSYKSSRYSALEQKGQIRCDANSFGECVCFFFCLFLFVL